MTDTTTPTWPPPPPLKAAARGHQPVWDPPAGLTRARRWTCPCGATVIDYCGNVYGSATDRDCTVTPPPADPAGITAGTHVQVTDPATGTWTGTVAWITGHLPSVTCTQETDTMWPGMTVPVAFANLQPLEDPAGAAGQDGGPA